MTSSEHENPFGNLEERLLSDESPSPVKSKKIKVSKIVKQISKVMKPFDGNKQAKKISSRKKLAAYLQALKNGEVNEGDDQTKVKEICNLTAKYFIEISNIGTGGTPEMLNFESLEVIENEAFKEHFDEFITENQMYLGYVKASVAKAHSYLSTLQSTLGSSSQYIMDNDKGPFIEVPIIKELCACLLYLGKYYPNCLKKIIQENSQTNLQKFEVSKMVSRVLKSLQSAGDLIDDKIKGIIFTSHNLSYALHKLELLEHTKFFAISESVCSEGEDLQNKSRFLSQLQLYKEEIQHLMYSLTLIVWEEAGKYENLESGKLFSASLKTSFAKLKTIEIKDDLSRQYLQEYCEAEVTRIFKTYTDGMDEDDTEGIQKVINNRNTLLAAIKKNLASKTE